MDVAWSAPVFRYLALLLGLSKGWGSAQSDARSCGHWDGLSQNLLELTENAGGGKVWPRISAPSFACMGSTATSLPLMEP